MAQVDYELLATLVEKAVQNADSFNKVWVGIGTVCVSLLALLVGAGTQMLIARWQRRSQERVATNQVDAHKLSMREQLAMQELVSKRTAVANIAAKRQVWIDELRKDIATYLRSWQEMAFRWEALIIRYQALALVPDAAKKTFIELMTELRMEALEVGIRLQLRLNPREAHHTKLRELMTELEETAIRFNHADPNIKTLSMKVKRLVAQMTELSQEMLKGEWERIKQESYVDPVSSS